jgi:sugar lactone lactonase YvrE
MTGVVIRPWSLVAGELTEGPRWDAALQELLWVDILRGQFHRATLTPDGSPDEVQTFTLDRHVAAVAPAAGGGYVVAAGQGFTFVGPDGATHELAQPEAGNAHLRMNDGACDEAGRFWAGTMAYDETPEAGCLFRLELDGTCTTMLTDLTISNGIGWSPDGGTMYLNDSGVGCLEAFSYDGPSGDIGNRRTLVRLEPPPAPDGLTVDEEGGVWVAVWGGGCVRRYSPAGKLLTEVRLPVERPTSCAFGGRHMTTLFVTSARDGLEDASLKRQPYAGYVFAVEGLGVRGLPSNPYRGRR